MADHELQCWSGGGHRSSASMPISVGVRRRPKQGLKCPRCDSPNTKFCYYNNYSLSQPRHFCKSCRRYWTEGGALRNVPVGGGCRKSKKFRSPAESRRHEIGLPPMIPRFNDHRPPASEPVLFSPAAMGFNYPLNINAAEACGSTVDENAINVSSIELLRSISQDLHWKLQTQKQKPAVLFGGEGTDHDGDQRDLIIYNSQTEPTPADEACGGSGSRNVQNSTAWFSECSNYAMLPSSTIVNISNTSSSDVNSTSYWNEAVPAWNDDKPAGFITPLP